MNRVSTVGEFFHNGEKIEGTLFLYSDGVKDKSKSFMFYYKNINIHVDVDKNKEYYNVAPLHCRIIDSLGIEGHKKYEKYLSIINDIKRNYIILNDKVYKYYCKLMINSPRVYFLDFKMADGESFDGTNKLTSIEDKGDKMGLFATLQLQVNEYYKNNGIEPDVSQLIEDKTKDYQETSKLIREIHESLK